MRVPLAVVCAVAILVLVACGGGGYGGSSPSATFNAAACLGPWRRQYRRQPWRAVVYSQSWNARHESDRRLAQQRRRDAPDYAERQHGRHRRHCARRDITSARAACERGELSLHDPSRNDRLDREFEWTAATTVHRPVLLVFVRRHRSSPLDSRINVTVVTCTTVAARRGGRVV